MKILVPSQVTPDKKSVRTVYISEIIKNLNEITDIDFFSFVYQPDRIKSSDFANFQILDIHDFSSAMDCLNQIKPDCVMITSYFEPIQYAFSLACKKLKIPLVAFYYFGYDFDQYDSLNKYNKIIYHSRNILSDRTPSDSDEQKSFFRRLRFILFKLKFLSNTKESINNKSSFIQDFFSYFIDSFFRKELSINEFPDLHLLPDNSWIEPLKKIGIKEEKLCLTGSPYWDSLYRNSKNYKPKKPVNNNISILIITDALVEHGIQSIGKFRSFFTKLINELTKKSEFSFSVKIHPVSEDKTKYDSLFEKLKISPMIYQKENVWDLLDKFDIVLSYGFSTIHSELAIAGIKTILLGLPVLPVTFPFVKEGTEYGNIAICTNISDLNNMILNMSKRDIILNDSFILARDDFLYKFDGKSGKRCSEAISNLVKSF